MTEDNGMTPNFEVPLTMRELEVRNISYELNWVSDGSINNCINLANHFMESPSLRLETARTLNYISMVCAGLAAKSGFHDDETALRKVLTDAGKPNLRAWADDAIEQAEQMRIVSEVAEACEGTRKPGPDSHLPQHDNKHVEYADAMVRLFDTAGKRQVPLGSVFVDKLFYNQTRPYKHGKKS